MLNRELNLFDTSLIGISGVLGSGIFILLAFILQHAGNMSVFAIILAAIPHLLAGLSYAELGAMYQRNDMESFAVKESLGDNAQSLITILIVLFLFLNTAPLFIFGAEMISKENSRPILIGSIILCAIINYLGIQVSSTLINIIIVVSIILFIALFSSSIQHNNIFAPSKAPSVTLSSFIIATSMSLFLFTGYDVVVKMSEEIQEPEKNINKSLIITLIVCTVIYCLLTFACQISPHFMDIAKSHKPISRLAQYLWGDGKVTTAISMAVVFSCAFTSMISISRYIYGIAQNTPLAYVDPIHKTPVVSILISAIVLIGVSLCGTGHQIALFANMFFMILVCILHVAVIILRVKYPNKHRPYKIPYSINNIPIIPIIGILISLFFAGFILYYKQNL